MKPRTFKALRHAEHTICDSCPHNSNDPQDRTCTIDGCAEHYFEVGVDIGYNMALEDLKAPKILAENRED